MIEQRIQIAGMAGTLNALRKMDPEVASQIGKKLNESGRKIRDDAKALVPSEPSPRMRGWTARVPTRRLGRRKEDGTIDASRPSGFPPYNASGAKKSIRSSRREFVLTIQSQDATLGVFELAGTRGGKGRGSSGSPQGKWFMALLPAIQLNTSRRPTFGRVLRQALRDNYPATREAIADAAYKAAELIQRRMP